MTGILDQFRKRVINSVFKEETPKSGTPVVNDLIALGVLLREVAQADKKFLPQEDEQIRSVLGSYSKIADADMPIVLRSIQEAALQRIDLYTFTREVSKDLAYGAKQAIVQNLFRVACADKDLAHEEHEAIRRISGLLGVDHKDFIEAKVAVKKEFDINTLD